MIRFPTHLTCKMIDWFPLLPMVIVLLHYKLDLVYLALTLLVRLMIIFALVLIKLSTLKPASDNLQEVSEMQKTYKTRHVCMGYFVLFMLLHETDFSSRGRSGYYAQDREIFLCDKA